MKVLIILIVLFQLFFSFKKPVWGLCYFIVIRILVPDIARSPIPFLSLNSLNSIILFAAFFFSNKNYTNLKLFKFIAFFISYLIVALLIPKQVPFFYELKYCFNFVVLQLLPILVAIVVIDNKKDLQSLLKCIFVSSAICIIYGLLCFIFNIDYPYNQKFTEIFASQSDLESANGIVMGGITGRIIGTAVADSWRYGMVVTPLFMLFFCIYKKLHNFNLLLLVVLSGITILLTIRRSPITSSMLFFCIYFAFDKNLAKHVWRLLKNVVLLLLFLIVLIYLFPELVIFKSILETSLLFWDDSIAENNEISGSSFEYRVFQLQYTLSFISSSFLFGNGWGAMYYKDHPAMNGWESMVFTMLAQIGVLGSLFFTLLIREFYRYSVLYSNTVKYGLAFIGANVFFFVLTDSFYLFYTLLGAVLLNKTDLFLSVKN